MTRAERKPRAATRLPLGTTVVLTEDVGDLRAGSVGRVVGYYGPRELLEYAVSFDPGGLVRLPRSVLDLGAATDEAHSWRSAPGHVSGSR